MPVFQVMKMHASSNRYTPPVGCLGEEMELQELHSKIDCYNLLRLCNYNRLNPEFKDPWLKLWQFASSTLLIPC